MKISPFTSKTLQREEFLRCPTAYCLLPTALLVILAGCDSPQKTPSTTTTPNTATVPSTTSPSTSGMPTTTLPQTSEAIVNTSPSTGSPTSNGTASAPLPQDITSDFTLAKGQVEATISSKPKDHNLRMRAAEFYMNTAHYTEAVPHLQAATKLIPDRVLAWIALGDAASLSGKFPLAEEAYNKAGKLDKNNPFVVRGRGQMFLLQRKFSQAQKVLEQGLKVFPKDVEISTALGNLYLILGKPRDAVNVLAPIMSKVSNRPDLHYLLGDAYERDLHIEAAILQMQEVVRLEPMNAQAWGRLGLYHNNLTRYADARKPLQRAIEIDPNEAYYHWALGDSYLLENVSDSNFEMARQEYEKALQLDPKNDKALYSYGMGLARRTKKPDLEKALEMFQRLIALKPADMNAHYKLYDTYRRLGRTQEAEAHRTKFKDLFAKGRKQTHDTYVAASFVDTAESHLKLGDKAMKEQNYKLAATEYELALTRNRDLDAARKGLLEAQKKQGLR